MGILKIVQLLLAGSVFVLTLFGIVYFRYLVEKELQALGRNWISVALSATMWIAPAALSFYVSLSIFIATESVENLYYIGGIHLVLSYLGSLLVRKVALTEGVL